MALGLLVVQLLRLQPVQVKSTASSPGIFETAPGAGGWVSIPGVKLPTITAFAFTSPLCGAGVSATGSLIVTDDGGASWSAVPGPPISEAETPGAVLVEPGVSTIVVATHVDESDYTGYYVRSSNGVWRSDSGSLGGVISGDGTYVAGGSGLVGTVANSALHFRQIPDSYSVPYYSIAHFADVVISGANDGLYAYSMDSGSTWTLHRLPRLRPGGYSEQLAAAAVGKRTALIGGLNGTLWRSDSQGREWARVKGLAGSQMVSALCIGSDGSQAVVGGGSPEGSDPFLACSADAGRTWRFEPIRGATGRIVAIANTATGFLVATSDGYILRRQ